jgi:ketosteroid isomerase-like protein
MSVVEIANQLVAFCKAGKNLEAINTLYADDIVSVEAHTPPGGGERVMRGIDAVRGKSEWWAANHEIHSAGVEGPWPHGDDRFAVRFSYDITNKPSGMRISMDEIAVFTLANGKIVREEFFYMPMGG